MLNIAKHYVEINKTTRCILMPTVMRKKKIMIDNKIWNA